MPSLADFIGMPLSFLFPPTSTMQPPLAAAQEQHTSSVKYAPMHQQTFYAPPATASAPYPLKPEVILAAILAAQIAAG